MEKKTLSYLTGLVLILITSLIVYRATSLRCGVISSSINIQKALGQKNIADAVIIGSGPAGNSAALYLARAGYHTIVIEGNKPGGQLTGTSEVENWPGLGKVNGPEAMENLKEYVKKFGAEYLSDSVTAVNLHTWPFEIQTEGHKIYALSVIIATGATPRMLNVPGEKEYWGRGVTTCAVCDAPFYKGKRVVIIGGGDSAAEQVLQLSPHVAHIEMLVRGDKIRASKMMQDRVKNLRNVRINFNKNITKILGDERRIHSVEIFDSKTKETTFMPIDGVFLAIGHEPTTALFKGALAMDDNGYLELNGRSQETSIEGVFAAGDVEDHTYRQAGVAAGNGIKAALDAGFFLQKIGLTSDIARVMKENYFTTEVQPVDELEEVMTEIEFNRIISSSNIPVIADFYAYHCPACMQMLPLVARLAKEFAPNVRIIKVNTDNVPNLVSSLKIIKIPFFVIFKNGNLVAQRFGTMEKSEMIAWIEKTIQ